MKLATIRTATGTRAVRVEGDGFVDLGFTDLGALLNQDDWQALAAMDGAAIESLGFAALIPRPGKVLCQGLNYRSHLAEMGRELPQHPTLFAKYPEALIGANDDIWLPPESAQVDWEAELAIIIGQRVRRAQGAQAEAAIAGFAVINDVTMRDWQYRSLMWLQGKTWEHSTPFGPYLVTPDELPGRTRPALDLHADVDGETVQQANTSDMVFDPVALVAYASTILTLQPGDVIACGTPGGVGHARKPERYLTAGQTLTTEISGLGRSNATTINEEI